MARIAAKVEHGNRWALSRLIGGAGIMAVTWMGCTDATTPAQTEPESEPVITVISGDEQSGATGEALPGRLMVRVTDERGRPLAGQVVTFEVVSGDGRVESGSAVTNRLGVAEDRWTLGDEAANQEVHAFLTGPFGKKRFFARFKAKGFRIGVWSLQLSPDTLRLGSLTESARLEAVLRHPTGTVIEQAKLSWATSDPEVATVDADGTVQARGNGSSVIRVHHRDAVDSTVVVVRQRPAAVSVDPDEARLSVGEAVELGAVVSDENGHVLDDANVRWASSETSVATVNATGRVRARSVGNTMITARSGGVTTSVPVEVTAVPVASILLTPKAAEVALGATTQLEARALDEGGEPLEGRAIAWATSDGSVAAVSTTGLVTSLKVGSATITAASEGATAEASIQVVPLSVASVSVSPASSNVEAGGTIQLAAVVSAAGGEGLNGRPIAWSSSNESAATVNETGMVSTKAAGSAIITATSEGVSGTATVEVSSSETETETETESETETETEPEPDPVATVAVTPATSSIEIGERVTLTAVMKSADESVLTGRPVTWRSSDATVATVNSNGRVTGVAAGAATITGTSEGVDGTARIEVAAPAPAPVATVQVSPGSSSLEVGEHVSLTATTKAADGSDLTDRAIGWTTSNAGVATVNSNGRVTAVAAGSATITATSESVRGTAQVAVAAPPTGGGGGGPVAAGWPNLPAGYAAFRDQPWDAMNSNGWHQVNRASQSRVVSDPTAPFSPSGVLEHTFPRGFSSQGLEPAVNWTDLGGRTEIFAGMFFKASDPWHGHSTGVNKIAFFWSAGHRQAIVFTMYGPPGGPYHLRPVAVGQPDSRNHYLEQNRNSVPMVPGQWHRLEFHLVAGTNNNGVLRWFQDGILLGEITNFNYVPGGFGEFELAPTWGGLGGPDKAQDDYFRYDHTFLAAPGTGGGGSTGGTGGSTGGTGGDSGGTGGSTGGGSSSSPADTIFHANFESGGLAAWQDGVDLSLHRVVGDPTRSGNNVLEITYPQGADGGWLTRFFMPGYDSVYVQYRVRLDPAWQGPTKLLALYGSRVDNQWSAFGKAGVCPNGTDYFSTMVTTQDAAQNPPPLVFYTNYPGMAPEADGSTCWGRHGDGNESYGSGRTLVPGQWHEVGFWVRLNDPGSSNGLQRMWIDGDLRGEWRNMRFRTTRDLRLNSVQLTASVARGSPRTQRVWVDDLIVTTTQPNR